MTTNSDQSACQLGSLLSCYRKQEVFTLKAEIREYFCYFSCKTTGQLVNWLAKKGGRCVYFKKDIVNKYLHHIYIIFSVIITGHQEV